MSIKFEPHECPPHVWTREGVGLRTCLACTITEEFEEMICYCDDKDEFRLTISEGSVVLECTECDKPLDLDAIGWWSEALEMQEEILVQAEFIIENGMEGPEPAYILLTATQE